MKVLLTGASSFTGFWIARALAESGAEVVAPLRGKRSDYDGVRGQRVGALGQYARLVEGVTFGEAAFAEIIGAEPFDVLCHHAARVADYRSPDFDVATALAENTHNLRTSLETMRGNGLKAVIATGSVFEQDEGIGDNPHRAFSPYGLSKGLTWQAVRYWCTVLELPLGKFVIANPFGPYEEPRFCAYLIRTWTKRDTAEVRTPRYLRDNLHVDLMAKAYADFATETVRSGRSARFGPGGYRETQGAFAERFAEAMRSRLDLPCDLKLAEQTDFSEPMVRLAPDAIDAARYGWSEAAAWDALAAYYKTVIAAA